MLQSFEQLFKQEVLGQHHYQHSTKKKKKWSNTWFHLNILVCLFSMGKQIVVKSSTG